MLEFAFGNYNFATGGSVAGDGLVRLNGQTNLLNAVTFDNVELTNVLSGPGDLAVGESMNWISGQTTGGGTTIIPSDVTLAFTTPNSKTLNNRALQNAGLVTIGNSGPVQLANAASINNAGIFDLRSDASINFVGGAPTVISNSGTFRKSASTGLSIVSGVNLNNTGQIDVQAGTLRMSNSGTSSGPATLAAGTVLEFAFGNYNFAAGGNVLGDGLVRLNGQTNLLDDVVFDNVELTNLLVGPGDLTVGESMTWISGQTSGGGATIIPPSATLSFTSANGKTLNDRALLNSGLTAFDSSGPPALLNGADVNNVGTIEFRADASINFAGGVVGAVHNGGTLRKNIATGVSNIAGLPFTNSGLVDVQTGTLVVNNFAQTAGTTRIAGGATLQSSQPIAIQGGNATGSGAVNAALTNTAGRVLPGDSIGQLSITGAYSQGAAAALEIEVAGLVPNAEHDRLAASGPATLAGELKLSFVNGFAPQIGDQFVVLSAGSINGTFSSVTGSGLFSVAYTSTSAIVTFVGAPCVGDFDGDGVVGLGDLSILLAHFGQLSGATAADGDVNGDGAVDLSDLTILLARFGSNCR